MPSNQRSRLDDRQHAVPIDPPRQDYQHDSRRIIGTPRFHLPFDVERQLLAEEQVLSRQAPPRSGRTGDEPQPIGRNVQEGS
jgi:hypothetical protein